MYCYYFMFLKFVNFISFVFNYHNFHTYLNGNVVLTPSLNMLLLEIIRET